MTDLEKIKNDFNLTDDEVSSHATDLYIKLSPDHKERGPMLKERYRNVTFFIADDGSGTWAELPFFLLDDKIARRNLQ